MQELQKDGTWKAVETAEIGTIVFMSDKLFAVIVRNGTLYFAEIK